MTKSHFKTDFYIWHGILGTKKVNFGHLTKKVIIEEINDFSLPLFAISLAGIWSSNSQTLTFYQTGTQRKTNRPFLSFENINDYSMVGWN